jgi:hypothetical protein
VGVVGAAMALASTGIGAGQPAREISTIRRFRSRPDLAHPALQVTSRLSGVADGHLFASIGTPDPNGGPLILDGAGEPIWFLPIAGLTVTDFRVQTYQRQPVLTWWQGKITAGGHGLGEGIIADSNYRTIKRVQAGNGFAADLHEFLLTDAGTALLTIYNQVPADLSTVGGPSNGAVWEGIVQEVDLETGSVIFEWHSFPEIEVGESYAQLPATGPFDYFHINSIDVDSDGNLLISARNTWAVYKLDRQTKGIMWRLGGKESSFVMGAGAQFEWQHDARRRPDGTITLFDDAAAPEEETRSRGLVLLLDKSTMSASVVGQYANARILSTSQGNFQLLSNGNYFIGWGSQPSLTEFRSNGAIAFDARFLTANQSYRAYRQPWHGAPTDLPALAMVRRWSGHHIAYMSWNGSTDVAAWQLLAGTDSLNLSVVEIAPRRGFETSIATTAPGPQFAARALDSAGGVLATSEVLRST